LVEVDQPVFVLGYRVRQLVRNDVEVLAERRKGGVISVPVGHLAACG
jgi:hypothetical protein